MQKVDPPVRFEFLYATYAASVARYARRRADEQTAADVVSDVFVVVWQRLDDVPEDALPWLLGCARRVLWHQQRAERRRARLAQRLAMVAPRAPATLPIPDSRLARALAMLSERDREALLLTAWEGLTTDQAALVLGCSPQAFRVRAHRARHRLAAAMDAPYETRPTTVAEGGVQ
jgi:RNA polymerase sigma-70 factor (ECF subfamily)